MDKHDIESRVIELAAARGGVEPAQVTLQSNLADDLHYDSLEQVEFAMEIEDEFRITIPDEKAQNVRTVGDAVDLVKQSLHKASES